MWTSESANPGKKQRLQSLLVTQPKRLTVERRALVLAELPLQRPVPPAIRRLSFPANGVLARSRQRIDIQRQK